MRSVLRYSINSVIILVPAAGRDLKVPILGGSVYVAHFLSKAGKCETHHNRVYVAHFLSRAEKKKTYHTSRVNVAQFLSKSREK